jgi:hypothetical protein
MLRAFKQVREIKIATPLRGAGLPASPSSFDGGNSNF